MPSSIINLTGDMFEIEQSKADLSRKASYKGFNIKMNASHLTFFDYFFINGMQAKQFDTGFDKTEIQEFKMMSKTSQVADVILHMI